MNHIYKVVWSTVTNSLVVVSELARSKGKAASTVSDVKDVSNKTTAVAVAAALQVAAVGTIAIGSFAPMEANAIVAISHVENGVISTDNSAKANASTVVSSPYYHHTTTDEGTRAYNYYNPGNPGERSSDLYSSTKYAHGIAIGCNTNAIATTGKGGSNGIAIGDFSEATGGLSVSLGVQATSRDVGAVAIGTAANASGFNSLAMMRQSAATGNYSTAIGSVSYAKGEASVALGASATAHGSQSIAIGSVDPKTTKGTTDEAFRTAYDGVNSTETYGNRSMALGSGAKTNGNDSFAVGSGARTGTFTDSVDIFGHKDTVAAVSANEAIAFGNDSKALKDKAVAFGNNATARGEESVAFAFNATSVGNQSVAIGTNSNAAHDRVVTIGTNSTATHNRSMAIGEEAKAKANHSLALGANATVTVANSVSLGADSFADEIGGSADMQINGKTYKFAGGQAQGTVSVGSGYDKDQARSGTVVRTITDLGAGRVLANSTDAINGSQLYALATEIEKGWNVATSATNEGSKTGDTTAAKVINGETVTFTADKNIAIDQQGKNITVKTEDDVTFNSVNTKDLTATGNTKVNNFTVEKGGKVDMGGNNVTNVAAPTADTDAANKKYVDDGRTQVKSTDGSVTITNSTTNGATVYDLKVNANVSYEGDSGKGTNKLSDPIRFAGVENETVTKAEDGKVTVGLADKAKESLKKADSAMQEFTVGTDAQHQATGITVNQKDKRFDIIGTQDYVTTTVTDGSVKVDIDQKFKDQVNTNTNNIADNKQNITNNANNITKNADNIAKNTQNITNNTNNITKNAEAIAKGFGLEAQDGNNVTKQLGEKVKVVGGNQNINTTVTADGKLAINLNNTLDLGDKGSVKIGSTKVDQDGLTITGGPSVTKTGINAGSKKITNVEAGEVSENSKEAVNGSQLYATNQNVTNNTNSINSLNTTVQAGWELQVEGNKAKDVTPKDKVANFKAGDNINVSIATDKSVVIATDKDVTFDNVKTQNLNVEGDTNVNNFTVKNGGKVDMGNNRVTNVATPTADTDAANKKYVDDARTIVTSNDGSVTIAETQNGPAKSYDLKVNANVSYAGDSGNGTNKLSEEIKFAGTTGEIVTEAKDGQVTFKLDDKVKNDIKDNADKIAKGFGLQAEDNKTVNKDLGEKIEVVGGNKNINTTIDGEKLKVNLNNTLDLSEQGSVKIGDTTINNGGLEIAGGPSVKKDGINAGDKKITNVEAGEISANSKDAVNGSQLYATNQNVTNNTNSINSLNTTVQAGWELQVGGKKAKNVTPTSNVANFIAGDNIAVTAEQDGSVKIATQKDVTFDNVTANNGLTVKKGATINMGDNVVTNVADGKVSADSKDAVNGSQLHQTNQNVTKLGDKLTAEGLNFVGDNGQVVHRDLGATLSVVGGAKADLSENNIGVEGKDGTLTVKLAKTLNDLTSANFTTNGQGNTVINGNGVTITPANGDTAKTVSLTNNGLNNGGNNITNVARGTKGTDAVNVDQLNEVSLAANAGWKLRANNAEESVVKPNDAVSLNNTDNNIVITKKAGDNNVTFGLNNTVKVGTNNAVTIDGTNGTVGGLTNKTFDPTKIVSGQAATEDQLKQVHGDLNTNITNASKDLTTKGLNFVGDDKEVVHRNLGDTLSIVGGAEEANLSDKNIGVVGSEGKLEVKLAKTLKELTNATFTTAGNNGNTVIDGKGVTITTAGGADKTVSLTDKGLNNGNNKITNVSAGTDATDAVNVSQLEKVNATAKAGWNLAVNDDAKGSNIAPNATVRLNNKDGNIKVTKEGNNVTFDLNNTVKVGTGDKAVTINGTDGTLTGLTNKTFTPGQIVSGRAATEDQLQSSHDQLNTNITNLSNNLTEKGLSFSADNKGAKVHRKLGETLSVVGNADPAKLSDKNIGVEANEANGQLVVKLAKELTDLTSANFTATGANTTINGNGVTITPKGADVTKTVSLTDKGLNNGGNNITNVANGTADTDAVNVSQLKEVSSTANAGWNLTVNGTSSSNVAPKATVDLANKDGNIVITKDNNNVTFALNSNLTVGGKDGKDGKDGSIGVNGKDGSAVVLNGKDGSIGLTGPKGADGKSATANITVAKGPAGVDGKDGANGTDGMTRIVYTDPNGTKHNVSTLNDGLSFVGNTGGAVAKKLNETLTIKGELANADAATAENIRVDNVGGDLIVKLAQNLTNLTTATFGKDGNDQLVINKDGLTIKPTTGGDAKTVSLTENGLNNGNNIITNVSSGLVGNDGKTKVALKDANGTTLTNAVNVGDLQNTVKDLTNATTGGFGLKDSAGNEVKQDLGTSIKVTGKDGVNAQVVTDGNGKALQIGLNSTVTVGNDQEPGVITVKGENGKDGVSINGKDGTIGLNGKDGANGSITVKNGQPGVDGKDGKTRIVYETTKDGKTTTEEVATLNDGLKFVGDKGEVIAKKLNDTLAVKGNLAKDANVTDKNLRVDNEKDELIIKMAKELTDLTNATFTSADSNTTIGGNGVTITPNTGDKVSLTDKGLNNGNNTITNVAEGKNGTDAVNVNQLERVNATANAGWNISANGANSTNVGPKGNVSLNNTDGNIVITKGTTDNNVTFALNNNLTVGKDGKDGKDGVDGQIGVNGKDGSSVVLNGKDGSIGLTGPRGTDGKDGASANISVADGKPGLDGKPGETKTRIVYETKDDNGKPVKEEVATLNDGLNFIGNQGDKIAKKLNDTLTVKGTLANDAAASSENVRVDSQDGALVVKLAQNLANLTTATFGNTATDKTVVGKDGVTISADKPENTVSLTDKGLNNGNNQITNVTSGLTDATGNKTDLANATSTNAVNVGDLKETVKNITTDGFGLKDDKGTEVKQDLGKTIQIKGKDGVTVTSNVTDKSLEVALAGDVVVNGKDGKDGTIGVKGADGKDGTTITKDAIVFNGVDGVNGKDGKDGAEGKASIKVEKGAKGIDGNDGKDGESKTRIVYEKPNGDKEEVATLKDGLHFVGDKGTSIAKKLNETLAIKGNLTSTAEVTDKNLRVDNEGEQLIVKMAKVLTDLTSANFTDAAGNNTIIGGNGVTITPKAGDSVSLTGKGLNNGNNTITNVKAGLNGTDAVNVNQLEKVNATAKAGWKLTNNGTNESTVTPNATVDLANKDGNIIITKDGNNVTFGFNSDLTVGGPGKDGKDGKDGSIGVKGKDGTTGVTLNGKDGSIGLTGAPGKDGKNASANITVAQGAKGLDGNDGVNGESKTRIVYEKPNGEKEEVATLNDGLNFVGNDGKVVTKKLNDTLAIKGGINTEAGLTAASDRNVGVRESDKGLNIVIAERPTFSGIIVDGKDGKDAEVKFAKDGKDGMSIVGTRGADGQNGLTLKGADGKDGVSFKEGGRITNVADGKDGKDAVNKDQLERVNATANAGWKLTVNNGNNQTTVTPNATVDLANTDGNIVITKDANNVTFALNNNLTVGGKDGKDGEIGVKGADGKTGVTLNGKDGSIGINGKDGSNGAITVEKGAVGVDGTDGANGKDGMTRIVYTDANGTKHNVSTLNDGLSFVGDTGNPIAKKLNQTLTIKGNLDAAAAVTDKNLRVDNVDGALIIKMAKSLTDLTNATFTSGNSNTTIGGNGLTITPNAGNTVSLTDKGLNNGNNQITNVTSGLVNRNGDKVDLANATGDVLTNAVNVGDLKDSVNNLTNATTGGFGLTDEKGGNVKADLGKTVTVIGDGSVKTEVVEKDGKKALQIGLTNNVTVGNDKEPGVITVKGENGKDGVSISGKDGISIKGENGKDAVSINGKDGNGAIAVNGKDGKTGVGLDGANGTIGINGKDGSNGTITLAKGEPGVDGKDGKTRIVYETKTPDGKTVTEEVATLKDGLKFVGDDGKVITKELNKTLTIKGNLSTVADVTDKNLRVDNVDGALIIKMARTLTDLTSATFTNVGGDKSVVDGNGLTITPANGGNTVSLTTKGLDNGGNKVINVAAGDVNATSTDAVNGSQLYAVSEVANKGWNIQTNGNVSTNVKPGDTVNFANGKNIEINNDGTNVTVGLAKDVDLGKDGSIKAGDTIMNNEGVKVGDKVSLTKDGLTAGDVKISAEAGINAGNKQITNVESGLGGTKLADAKGDTLKNAANIGDLQTAISGVTDAEQGGGFGLADDNGTEVKQSLGKTIQVKGDGNVTTTVTNGSLTVGLNKDVDLGKDGSLTAGGTKVSEKGVSFADSLVNLTSNGLNNGGNKVTNVKAGEVSATSTDAVNGSQLYATNQNVTNLQNNVAKGWNIEAGTVEGSTGKVTGASKSNVAMGDTVGVKAGNNIEITQDGSNIAIATSATPTFDTVTVGKDGNTATVGTVQDEHGSAIKVTGADGKSETRINNVADGKADNDAVNVRQLRGVAQNVANIDNRVSKLDKRVRGIGANSAAASSLPQVMLPGKSMVAVAGGAYSGASAVAVGYSRASDNGKVILKVNGTANSAGHYSGGVGVGYQW
ncbi:YadA-like family protein [Actinobacillus suis]|uniref:Autotransporter adhesin n=2 Tax=Actinobacillus suis TaxID=716 RepID=K0FY93_ACTSU|nr:YadA-like family protein [Actinobacillus suis]AFU19467.1 autotransporter adhesin [Actinobacillus suis H91-0380]OQS58124.1 adhesin [Actinobacillus suis]OQS59522.1 adhesin [Actinobacillus suis]